MDLRIGLAGLTILVTMSFQGATLDWDRADREVRRLPPSAFSAFLPAQLIKKLNARGCTIPQTFISTEPHNIIRGQFAGAGQFDWAVLCSVQRISSLLVFWGGPAQCASKVASGPDKSALQVIGEGKIGYSWKIAVSTKEYVRSRNPDLQSVSINHDGIESMALEKGSAVYYCHQGKWMYLRGAD